jgi:hypothetical protein
MGPIYLTEGENYPRRLLDVRNPRERLSWGPALQECYERLTRVSPEQAEAFRQAVAEWSVRDAHPLPIPPSLLPIPAVDPVVVPVSWPSDAGLEWADFNGDLFTPGGEPEWNFGEDLDAFAPDTCFAGSSPDDVLV